jgi:hypothetical protein
VKQPEDYPYPVRDNVRSFLAEAKLTDERCVAHRTAEQLMRISGR